MDKPCTKLSVKFLDKSVPKSFPKNDRIFKLMEFKMRRYYDSGDGSMYQLTDKEKSAFRNNLDGIIRSEFIPESDKFYSTMINGIYNDIIAGNLRKYNKRAICAAIDIIRRYWNSVCDKVELVENK